MVVELCGGVWWCVVMELCGDGGVWCVVVCGVWWCVVCGGLCCCVLLCLGGVCCSVVVCGGGVW